MLRAGLALQHVAAASIVGFLLDQCADVCRLNRANAQAT